MAGFVPQSFPGSSQTANLTGKCWRTFARGNRKGTVGRRVLEQWVDAASGATSDADDEDWNDAQSAQGEVVDAMDPALIAAVKAGQQSAEAITEYLFVLRLLRGLMLLS